MKFAILGHFIDENHLERLPKEWIHDNLIVSQEFNFNETNGYILGIMLTAKQMMNYPKETVRQKILDAVLFAQNELDVEIIQLGALTTSVTTGGRWLAEQKNYTGFVNHGDSYTTAVTCQAVEKALNLFEKKSFESILAIVGAYGIIGEAVSKTLVSQFSHSILIGRREEKLEELTAKLKGSFETTVDLKTKDADIIVTATSHPKALLGSEHLKENAIVVDVSQPPNLSQEVCQKRSDICRIDGGYVDYPAKYSFSIPGMPVGKCFSCMAEVIMQAMDKQRENHVGSIDLEHLRKTEKWGEKYGFNLNELTNFGKTINLRR